MDINAEDKKITDYFRSNIFEALSAYNGWKMIAFSKSSGIVPKELAEKYVAIQNGYVSFFVTAERSFLITFVLKILHPFDDRNDSYSLYKIDRQKTLDFVKKNNEVISELRDVRNKVFAHKDFDTDTKQYQIPSIDRLDDFFKNLIVFYNELTKTVDGSLTIFDRTNDIKEQTQRLFMDLYRGSQVRKTEIEIKWDLEENPKKASNIL